jgi:hypothetical protein
MSVLVGVRVQTARMMNLAAVNADAEDPEKLAAFWAGVTGGEMTVVVPGIFARVSAPAGGPTLTFQQVAERTPGRNSLHLDFHLESGREEEVARLVALGAVHKWDVFGEVPGLDWTTLADPEGNLFCVGGPPAA